MGGTPQSRGCANCRRRKKGCDLGRPSCSRCAKLNDECSYERDSYIFHNYSSGSAATGGGLNKTILRKGLTVVTRTPSRRGSSQSSAPTSTLVVLPATTCERTPPPTPITVDSSGAWRTRVYSSAAETFFPSGTPPSWYKLVGEAASRCPALATAQDAVNLLQVGWHTQDDQLLDAGVTMYTRTLGLLRDETKDIVSGIDNIGKQGPLLCAVHCVRLCEAFSCIGANVSTCTHHNKGLEAFWSLCQADVKAEYRDLLSANFNLFALWEALVTRSRPFVDIGSQGLCGYVTPLPKALSNANDAYNTADEDDNILITAHLQRLQKLARDLKQWEATWIEEDKASRPYNLAAPSTMTHPIGRMGSKSTAFLPLILDFRNFEDAQDYIILTACLLSIDRMILDLLGLACIAASPKKQTELQDNVTMRADTLCMSIGHLCRPSCGKMGAMFAVGPLRLAHSWYCSSASSQPESSASEKAAWCMSTAQALESTGVRAVEAIDKMPVSESVGVRAVEAIEKIRVSESD